MTGFRNSACSLQKSYSPTNINMHIGDGNQLNSVLLMQKVLTLILNSCVVPNNTPFKTNSCLPSKYIIVNQTRGSTNSHIQRRAATCIKQRLAFHFLLQVIRILCVIFSGKFTLCLAATVAHVCWDFFLSFLGHRAHGAGRGWGRGRCCGWGQRWRRWSSLSSERAIHQHFLILEAGTYTVQVVLGESVGAEQVTQTRRLQTLFQVVEDFPRPFTREGQLDESRLVKLYHLKDTRREWKK